MVTTTYNQSANTTTALYIANTDLLKDTPAGAMTLDVSNEKGFLPGMAIVIAPNTPLAEENTVRATGTIDLKTPTKFAHKAGTKVVQKTTEVITTTNTTTTA